MRDISETIQAVDVKFWMTGRINNLSVSVSFDKKIVVIFLVTMATKSPRMHCGGVKRALNRSFLHFFLPNLICMVPSVLFNMPDMLLWVPELLLLDWLPWKP